MISLQVEYGVTGSGNALNRSCQRRSEFDFLGDPPLHPFLWIHFSGSPAGRDAEAAIMELEARGICISHSVGAVGEFDIYICQSTRIG
jgi:hypothetical protein